MAFWANYVFILLVSCWLPMSSLKSVLKDPSGRILQENVLYVRTYQSYLRLFKHFTSFDLFAVAMHLGISFLICFMVWYAVLRWRMKPENTPQEETPEDDGNGTA